MPVRERRRGNQSNPQDKANYAIIGGFFLTVWIILLKQWTDAQFTVVTVFVGTMLGGLSGFLAGRAIATQTHPETQVNAATADVTARPEPAKPEIFYQDDGKTKELTPDQLQRYGLRQG